MYLVFQSRIQGLTLNFRECNEVRAGSKGRGALLISKFTMLMQQHCGVWAYDLFILVMQSSLLIKYSLECFLLREFSDDGLSFQVLNSQRANCFPYYPGILRFHMRNRNFRASSPICCSISCTTSARSLLGLQRHHLLSIRK